MDEYPFVVRPLSEEDGGGFLVEFNDLPGCVSDGDTVEEAIENVRDAFEQWMAVQVEREAFIPLPGQAAKEFHERIAALLQTIDEQAREIQVLKARIEAGGSDRPALSRWSGRSAGTAALVGIAQMQGRVPAL
jgi:predicted RNase H-like HicB family nuclease